MKHHFKKQDFLLITGILLLSVILFSGNRLINRRPSAVVKVITDAEVQEELDLNRDTELIIHGNGGTNTLVIQNGGAYISEATCPDKLCIHQGTISKTGELLVCLPNQVIVRIDAEN